MTYPQWEVRDKTKNMTHEQMDKYIGVLRWKLASCRGVLFGILNDRLNNTQDIDNLEIEEVLQETPDL